MMSKRLWAVVIRQELGPLGVLCTCPTKALALRERKRLAVIALGFGRADLEVVTISQEWKSKVQHIGKTKP